MEFGFFDMLLITLHL